MPQSNASITWEIKITDHFESSQAYRVCTRFNLVMGTDTFKKKLEHKLATEMHFSETEFLELLLLSALRCIRVFFFLALLFYNVLPFPASLGNSNFPEFKDFST